MEYDGVLRDPFFLVWIGSVSKITGTSCATDGEQAHARKPNAQEQANPFALQDRLYGDNQSQHQVGDPDNIPPVYNPAFHIMRFFAEDFASLPRYELLNNHLPPGKILPLHSSYQMRSR